MRYDELMINELDIAILDALHRFAITRPLLIIAHRILHRHAMNDDCDRCAARCHHSA